jgi:DNA-directed RNA polymerase I subunit RPA1
MNISQPVGSALEGVDFTTMTPEEIRAMSVRRIENETTFDTLLNPVPGGLYDPALGSWGDVLYVERSMTSKKRPLVAN